jgi:predicted PurR-regulated permease PerM
MTKHSDNLLYRITTWSAFLVLAIYGIVQAKSFLAPLLVALILSLLLLPLVRWLGRFKMNKNITALLSTLVLFLISLGFFALVTAQLNNLVEKRETIKNTMEPKIENLLGLIVANTPITEKKIADVKKNIKNLQFIGSTDTSGVAITYVSNIFSFFGAYLLVFIYVFFLLRFRSKFKTFILKLFSEDKNKEVQQSLHEISSVAQGYLLGKLKLIGLLAVIYSIGLGVSGVSNFILVALLAAIFTIIPYLGNVLGFCLALLFGYLMHGEVGVLIGISITFVLGQFIESYILQPYVVGDEVDLNPFFVILVVIIGNLMWGIMGMVVAIPVLGILNVIFLHVPKLKPFGFLFEKNEET